MPITTPTNKYAKAIDETAAALRSLAVGLTHFAKTTNRMFYYYIEEMQVKESEQTGNLMVSYSGTNENGTRSVFRVQVDSGTLIFRGSIKSLIEGVDAKSGLPVVGDKETNDSVFLSAFSLLVAEIDRVSEKIRADIGEVMVYGISERGLPAGRASVLPNGELKVTYGTKSTY